jgi:hypothetical protein
MWMFIAGASFGCVMGFLAFALVSSSKTPDCVNCTGLIEREHMLSVREADIRALGEDIKSLKKANAALRGAYKRAVGETQRIAFLSQKEA